MHAPIPSCISSSTRIQQASCMHAHMNIWASLVGRITFYTQALEPRSRHVMQKLTWTFAHKEFCCIFGATLAHLFGCPHTHLHVLTTHHYSYFFLLTSLPDRGRAAVIMSLLAAGSRRSRRVRHMAPPLTAGSHQRRRVSRVVPRRMIYATTTGMKTKNRHTFTERWR
jgi:hypothetical protein